MKFNSLKEKCEYYRKLTDYRLVPNTPIIAMVDGHSFSSLMKKRFNLPFDNDFINMMNETAKYVCENVQGCKFAFVQSDEISFLITDYENDDTDSFFGYRLCKMQSLIASMATAKFNQLFTKYQVKKIALSGEKMLLDEMFNSIKLVDFDCKVWSVPTVNDAFAWFLYRQNDCIRNSKQQAAQTYISHKMLHKLHTDDQIKVLYSEKGISWENDYDDGKKYGRLIYKSKKVETKEIQVKHKVGKEFTYESKLISYEREKFDAHNAKPFNEWKDEDGNNFVRSLIPSKHE